jgi:mRNA-degrading endonuclease RelE of RelBE toxin-antitoxin system
MANHVPVSAQAKRDLKRLDRRIQGHIAEALAVLLDDPLPGNANVTTVVGSHPWERMRPNRAPAYRILFRRLTKTECEELDRSTKRTCTRGYLVGRIVHRSDLEEAAKRLNDAPPRLP